MNVKDNGMFVDYYALLGIDPSADPCDIRGAFLQKAHEHHPDVGGSQEIMQQLNLAYKTLRSPATKASYDSIHDLRSGDSKTADYKYENGQRSKSIDDMSDAEIDQFLDTMLDEFRHGVPTAKKATVKQRIKKMFEL